jgi:hypothetical protein
MLRLAPVTVNFAACLEVTGLRALLVGGQLEFCLRFRVLRALPRTLACCLEALDQRQEPALRYRITLNENPALANAGRGDDLLVAVKWNATVRASLFTEVQFGLYDAQSNKKLPICASSLPVAAGHTVARARLNEPPPAELVYAFGWPALTACRVVLSGGVELAAYSVQCHEESVWLRLKWRIHGRSGNRLRFQGCILPSDIGGAAVAENLEQDMVLDPEAPIQMLEQHIMGPAAGLCWSRPVLRGRVFDLKSESWLRVLDCSLPALERQPYFLLPVSARDASLPVDDRRPR